MKSYLGVGQVLLSASVSPCLLGCFATYPETNDASSFKEFSFRAEIDPPCLESPSISEEYPNVSYGPVCEATIVRESSGIFSVVLGVRTDYQLDSPFLPTRVMTQSETERMLELFSNLRINRHPFPNCTIFRFGFGTGEVVLRWDDFELVETDCERPRLDWKQVITIERFLHSLVTDASTEAP